MAKGPVRDTYRQDLPTDRPLGAADLQALRFGITLRGYSMAQVDDVLDRLTTEIAQRDARIAQLSAPSGVAPAQLDEGQPSGASDSQPVTWPPAASDEESHP